MLLIKILGGLGVGGTIPGFPPGFKAGGVGGVLGTGVCGVKLLRKVGGVGGRGVVCYAFGGFITPELTGGVLEARFYFLSRSS